jgi:hypothetical protein
MQYDSLQQYIQTSPTQKVAKIQHLQQIMDAMDDALLAIAAKGAVTEFVLNDGQTVVKGVYNSAASIKAIQDSLQLRINKLVNQVNGRVSIITDAKNMQGPYGY